MAKGFAVAFYKSAAWQKAREAALIRDRYKCRLCGSSKHLEVHHMQHLTPDNITDGSVALNLNNLQTLCRDCHFKQHEADKRAGQKHSTDCNEGYHFDANGFLIADTPSVKK